MSFMPSCTSVSSGMVIPWSLDTSKVHAPVMFVCALDCAATANIIAIAVTRLPANRMVLSLICISYAYLIGLVCTGRLIAISIQVHAVLELAFKYGLAIVIISGG